MQTTTGANGRYGFTLNSPSATSHSVEPFGLQGYTKRLTGTGAFSVVSVVNGTTSQAGDLVLDLNGSISGFAHDETGAAVAGAPVSVLYNAPWANCTQPATCSTRPTSRTAGTPARSRTRRRSGADGTFSLSAPATSGVVLLAHKLDLFTTPMDVGGIAVPVERQAAATVDLEYRNFVTVTGLVGADTGVLPGMTVNWNGTDAFWCNPTCSSDHSYSGSVTIDPGAASYTPALPARELDTYYLRLVKSGTTYTGSWSLDGQRWTSSRRSTNPS